MTADKKIEIFKQEILKLFPGINTNEILSGNKSNEDEVVWNNIHFNIPSENKNLVNSPYYYDKKTVVHFSNIFALNSIIQEKAIRLYNLHNLNDPREFIFASKVFNLNKEIVNDSKDNLFLISFCEREILKKVSGEFNMWRLYGQNGKGLAIVFSIANNPANWDDFHISKVVYGSNSRRKFSKLLKIIEELNLTKPHINVDFGKLYAFHKSKLFELEQEVRIVFDRRKKRVGMGNRTVSFKGETVFPIIKSDLYKLIENKDNIRYLKLSIFYNGIEKIDKTIPLLKIEQIIIGYNFIEEINSLKNSITEICKEQLGYIPTIKQTRLKNFYWDIKKKE